MALNRSSIIIFQHEKAKGFFLSSPSFFLNMIFIIYKFLLTSISRVLNLCFLICYRPFMMHDLWQSQLFLFFSTWEVKCFQLCWSNFTPHVCLCVQKWSQQGEVNSSTLIHTHGDIEGVWTCMLVSCGHYIYGFVLRMMTNDYRFWLYGKDLFWKTPWDVENCFWGVYPYKSRRRFLVWFGNL